MSSAFLTLNLVGQSFQLGPGAFSSSGEDGGADDQSALANLNGIQAADNLE